MVLPFLRLLLIISMSGGRFFFVSTLFKSERGHQAVKLLEEHIKNRGTVLPGNVLKVDSFLNHQIDPILMQLSEKNSPIGFEILALQK